MNREIKFRVWDKKKKKMFYSYDNFLKLEGNLWSLWEMPIGKDKLKLLTNHSNGVLQQFTELKDKNGKEIYEGDIINKGNGLKPFLVKDIRTDTIKLARMIQFEQNNKNTPQFKIIGNIYENKELLKELKGGGLNE